MKRNTKRRFASIAIVFAALAGPAAAQTIQPLVVEGDTIAGVGLVTTINGLAVNDNGDWLVEADTDAATTADLVLIRNGVLFLREDQALTQPAGANISSFDDLWINNNGDASNNLFLRNTGGSNNDSGIYWNDVLVLQEGFVSNSPSYGGPTPYIGFFGTKINDANQIAVMASVDDPTIASTVDRSLVILSVDGTGALISETVFAKEGDVFAAVAPEAITDISTGPHEWAFSAAGDVMFAATLTGGSNNSAIFINTTLIVRRGDPSPVAGRSWTALTGVELDLSNNGAHYVYSGALDGDPATNLLIVKNGAKFRQEGDTLPAIAPYVITSFGSGPVHVSDDGDVLWYGDWDDPVTTRDKGLFINDELIVQIGVTQINGATVTTLRGITDGYALSRNGRYVIFEAVLDNGDEGAFLFERQLPIDTLCWGDGSGGTCPCGNFGASGQGCANSTGSGALLSGGGSASVSAGDLVLTGAQLPPGQPGLFFQGLNAINGGNGNPFGDGLRCAGGGVVRIQVRIASGAGVAFTTVNVPATGGASAGDTRHYQFWYRDPVGSPCGAGFNFTPMVRVIYGA